MEDRELREAMRHFDAVWSRVSRGRDPAQAAAERGVRLMPRGKGCAAERRPCERRKKPCGRR